MIESFALSDLHSDRSLVSNPVTDKRSAPGGEEIYDKS